MGWKVVGKLKSDKDLFNKAIIGGSMIPIGQHKSVIQSIELDTNSNGKPFADIIFGDSQGGTIKYRLYPFKDGQFNKVYYSFVSKLFGDFEACMKFSELLEQNPELFKSLVGMHITIDVQEGKNGYTSKPTPEGFSVVDVTTGNVVEGFENKYFASFKEIKQAVEIFNEGKDKALKLYPAYPEVNVFNCFNDDEGRQINGKALTAIASSVGNTKPNSTSTAPVRSL